MLKKIISSLLIPSLFMGLIGAVTITGSLYAEEPGQLERIEIGTRAQPEEERIVQEETRTKLQAEEHNKQAKQVKARRGAKSLFGGVYHTLHPGAYHYISAMSFFGDTLELEDGSVWFLRSSDIYKVKGWHSTDPIVITPDHSWMSLYQFVMTNQNTGEAIGVNLHLSPYVNGPFTHWIIAIDDYNSTVYLEDGSFWKMSIFDGSILYRWVVGDSVIIGVNDGYFSSSRPNILINVNTLDYVSGYAAY